MKDLPSPAKLLDFKNYLLEYEKSQYSLDLLRIRMQEFFSELPIFPIEFIQSTVTIIRGRLNRNNSEDVWRRPSQIGSVKDKTKVDSIGRCHLKENPMFYGALALPDNYQALPAVILEISNIAGDDDKLQSTFYTFGKWQVLKPLICLPVLFTNYQRLPQYLVDKNESCRAFIKANFSECSDLVLEVFEFIGNKFQQENSAETCAYEYTATYSSVLFELFPDLDAIIYPSQKAVGEAINIVIKPECVDIKLAHTHMIGTKAIWGKTIKVDYYRIGEVKTHKCDKVIWRAHQMHDDLPS